MDSSITISDDIKPLKVEKDQKLDLRQMESFFSDISKKIIFSYQLSGSIPSCPELLP